MKKQEEQKYLKYGQIVRIHGNQVQSLRGMVVAKGFLFLISFTDLDAKYMTFSNIRNIKNYRQSLFQILPKGIFQIHDQLLKMRDNSQYQSLMNRANTQKQQYQLLIQVYKIFISKMGQYIYFGNDVIFKHVDSDGYLSGSVQCSDGGLGSFKVQLSTSLSSMLVFKLLPFRSYQKQGDKIGIQCPLRIKNTKNRCYLYIETEQNKKLQKSIFQQQFKRIRKDQSTKFNVVTTYSQLQTWLFHLHQDHQQVKEQSLIRTHDIVYLIHTQLNGFLTSKDNMLILKQPLSQDPMLFSGLWQIEFLPPPKISPTLTEQQRNSAVQQNYYENSFCLREVLSGKSVGMKQFQIKNQMRYVPFLHQSNQNIIIKGVKGSGNVDIKHECLVKIANFLGEQIMEIDVGQHINTDQNKKRTFFSSDLEYKSRNIFYTNNEIDHGFRMLKMDKLTLKEVLFAISSHQSLGSFAEKLRYSAHEVGKILNYKQLKKIDKTIAQLISFIQECSVSEIDKPKFQPNKKRQIIFKDLFICDIFFQILDLIGNKIRQQIFRNNKNQHQQFKQIFRKGYMLIMKIIQNNRTTKLYVAQWFDIILNQAIQIDQPKIHMTLNQMLKQNELIVGKYLNMSIIQKILDIFVNQPPHQKYLKIFRSSCICNNLAIINNQNNIIENFLRRLNEVTQTKFMFQFSQNQLQIRSCISKKNFLKRDIVSFHKNSDRMDVSQSWNYFLSYINLLADVCYGRNNLGKKFVQKNIDLDKLCSILQNPKLKQIGIYSKDLLKAILRLINYAFVDTVKHNPIIRLSRIRQYNNIHTDISRTQSDQLPQNGDLERVMNYLILQLKKFDSFQSSEFKQLKFFLTILDLLRSTLVSGYWLNIDQLYDMVPCLLKIMKNEKAKILNAYIPTQQQKISKVQALRRSFKHYKQQIMQPIDQNILIIQCKLLATEILGIIIDFQIDVRVSQISKIFKTTNQTKQQCLYSVEYWKKSVNELFVKRALLSKVDQNQANFHIIFIEMSQHKHPRLLAKSVEILKRIIQLRKETVRKFVQISIYVEGQTLSFVQHAKNSRKKLYTVNDQNMIKAEISNQSMYHYPIWDQEQGIIQDLYFFAQSLKSHFTYQNKKKIPILRYEKLFPQNHLYLFFNEREKMHHLHQKLIKSLDIHPELINFLKHCKRQKLDEPNLVGSLARKLIHAVYLFLDMMIKNNLHNKKQILYNKSIFKSHLPYNCGAIELLRDLYYNNKVLLFKQEQINQISQEIAQLIEQTPLNSFYKSKLLDFYRCLIYFNEKAIHNNADMILAKLQDCKKKNINYRFETQDMAILKNQLEKYEENYEKIFKTGNNVLQISAELTYYITIFNLFSNLIEDVNRVNIGKCRQVHSYLMLIDIMSQAKNCWPLKRNLRSYINRLFYTDRNYENIFDYLVAKQMKIFIEDLNCLIKLKKQKDDVRNNKMSKARIMSIELKDPVRFKYLETYIYLYLQEMLISLHQIFHNEFFTKKLQEILTKNYLKGVYEYHYYILRIVERLACIKQSYIKYRFVFSFINNINHTIKDKLLNKFMRNYTRIFDKNLELIKKENDGDANSSLIFENAQKKKKSSGMLESRSKMLIDRILKGQIDSYIIEDREELKEKFPLTFFLPEKYLKEERLISPRDKITGNERLRKKLESLFTSNRQYKKLQINQEYNQKLRMIGQMMQSQKFNLYLNQEFYQSSQQLFNIDAFSTQFYKFQEPYISLKEYLMIIVKTNSVNPNAFSKDLKIFFFRQLRRFIMSKNKRELHLLDIDQWESEYWKEFSNQIVIAQNFLEECGVAEFLCNSLKDKLEQEILLAHEIIQFGIAFTLGGNNITQKSILKKLKQDHKNEVFVNLSNLISHIGITIYNHYIIRKQHRKQQKKFAVTLTDTYDYYDNKLQAIYRYEVIEEESFKDKEFRLECVKVFTKIFKFFQFLCQNNNIEGKKFIRCQTDTNDNKNIYSINLIQLTTMQIRKLFKIMNKYIVSFPNYLLDFINQVTQIPCYQNQITLCLTTFFEDICYMASLFYIKSNRQARKFYKIMENKIIEDAQQLYSIYYKFVDIVLSVLQGNDKEIEFQLASKLESKFLIEIINKELKTLQIEEQEQMRVYLYKARKEKFFKQNLLEIIKVLIILKKLSSRDPNSRIITAFNLYCKQHLKFFKILKLVQTRIGNIEIINNQKKQMVYFPIHPVFNYLSDDTRDKIMEQIKRQTQRQKLVGLFSLKQQIFTQIQHNHYMSQNSFIGLPLSSQTISTIYSICTFLSIIINCLILLEFEVYIEYYQVTYVGSSVTFAIVQLFSLLQVIFTCIYIVGWWRIRAYLALCKQMQKNNMNIQIYQSHFFQFATSLIENNKKKKSTNLYETYKIKLRKLINYFIHQFNFLIKILYVSLGQTIIGSILTFIFSKIKQFIITIIAMFKWEDHFIPSVFYLVSAILGTFYKQYFFLLHQFIIFSRINVLQNVFQAIAYNAKQLIIVSSLGIVFVYVFCLIGFDNYVESIYAQHKKYCTTILECVFSLYISGQIGGSMDQFQILRFTSDLIYFIFFGLLFGNIISGIMIDTFAQLRDKRNELQKDKKNYCFICGIDKATLEKENQNFQTHIKREHFLWNYIFYLYCVKKKNPMDYTGLQYKLAFVKPEEVGWVPVWSQQGQGINEHLAQANLTLHKLHQNEVKKLMQIQSIVHSIKQKLE